MAFTRTYDGDEPVRVNKWLGQTGVCSRREAESLIAVGLVSIDGEVIQDAGRKIEPGQTLTLNDSAEAALASGMTILLHKPVGYVSGQPDPGKIPAVRLLKTPNRVVDGLITEGKLSKLRHGLELNGKPLKPARVTQIEPQRLRFILTEGKYRQIRRMCELVGLEVTDLYRIRVGPLLLGDLPEGRWRHLTPDERTALIVQSAGD
jgi:23S rRNA pseudouridine2604 synthase